MFYYKFTADTQYCGTQNEFYLKSEEELSSSELSALCDEYARQNGECFEYLVDKDTEYCEDEYEDYEDFEEAIEQDKLWYWESVSCEWEEISEEEYNDNV